MIICSILLLFFHLRFNNPYAQSLFPEHPSKAHFFPPKNHKPPFQLEIIKIDKETFHLLFHRRILHATIPFPATWWQQAYL